MAEPVRALRTVVEPTCKTCPLGGGTPRINSRNGLHEVECRAGARPRLVAEAYWCGQHPGRQRDRLAARAMQGWIACMGQGWATPELNGPTLPASIAAFAYRIADAMLEEGGHAV